MLFDFDLTVPRRTAADNPAVYTAKLTRGTLTEIRVIFPPGPATLVYCVIRDRLHQIMPANPEGSLNFDDSTVISRMEYEMADPPYELLLYGWSPDTIYEHTITFQFELQPVSKDTWNDFMQYLFSAQSMSV